MVTGHCIDRAAHGTDSIPAARFGLNRTLTEAVVRIGCPQDADRRTLFFLTIFRRFSRLSARTGFAVATLFLTIVQGRAPSDACFLRPYIA